MQDPLNHTFGLKKNVKIKAQKRQPRFQQGPTEDGNLLPVSLNTRQDRRRKSPSQILDHIFSGVPTEHRHTPDQETLIRRGKDETNKQLWRLSSEAAR